MATRKRGAAKGGTVSHIIDEIAQAFSRLGAALHVGNGKSAPAPAAPAARRRGRRPGRPAGAVKRGPGRPKKVVAAAPKAAKPAAKRGRPAAAGKKNPNLQLQGQYMAAIRSLSETNKNRVRKIRADKGVEAAIVLAKKLG